METVSLHAEVEIEETQFEVDVTVLNGEFVVMLCPMKEHVFRYRDRTSTTAEEALAEARRRVEALLSGAKGMRSKKPTTRRMPFGSTEFPDES